MKKVTVNGIQYLGNMSLNAGNITIRQAMALDSSTSMKNHLQNYLKKWNSAQLVTEEFGGNGVSYSVTDLTDVEELQLKICRLNMAQAKKIAVTGLENKMFDTLMGK